MRGDPESVWIALFQAHAALEVLLKEVFGRLCQPEEAHALNGAQAVLSHPRHKDPAQGKIPGGLTRLLDKHFLPGSGGTRVWHRLGVYAPRTRGARSSGGWSGRGGRSTCALSGTDHGTAVHEQWCAFVRILVEDRKTPIRDRQARFRALVAQSPSGLDSCVLGIAQVAVRERLVPLAAEFVVWDEVLGVRTPVDVVWLEVSSLSVFLGEIKTGYEAVEFDGLPEGGEPGVEDRRMMAPFDRIPCTPRAYATLQIVLPAEILCRRYPGLVDRRRGPVFAPSRGGVIHVCQTSHVVEYWDLPDWARDRGYIRGVYDALLKRVAPRHPRTLPQGPSHPRVERTRRGGKEESEDSPEVSSEEVILDLVSEDEPLDTPEDPSSTSPPKSPEDPMDNRVTEGVGFEAGLRPSLLETGSFASDHRDSAGTWEYSSFFRTVLE